ncbi:MAG: precorrin-8X methylmutase [Candidatus Omnitrophota bacterium]|nr:precorrin-8X methylmutase [Candidatus Omnitrophota bacterium]
MSRAYMSGDEIEKQSMSIIEKELGALNCSFEEKEIIKRVVHTTVDVEFGRGLIFHPEAVNAAIEGIKDGRRIITDVHMVKAGIRAYDLKDFGNEILCFFDKDKTEPNPDNVPRAVLAMRKSKPYLSGSIVAIGNAPTALLELIDIMREDSVRPHVIIGVPIGFVGAAESKLELQEQNVPFITNSGRKGGSTAACGILNAIIKLARNHG